MGAYTKVDRHEAVDRGCKIAGNTWIDVSKGDETNPEYRSSLICRELKINGRPDLFAATPLLEGLRLIVGIGAPNQEGDQRFKVPTSDVERAYFYAKSKRPLYIELLEEDKEPQDEDKFARLNLSLYGACDAAQNWQHAFARVLEAAGFKEGADSPCNCYHPIRQLRIAVHGDDFTSAGTETQLKCFEKVLDTHCGCKRQVLGPGASDSSCVRALNGTITWTSGGLQYETDRRHAEI